MLIALIGCAIPAVLIGIILFWSKHWSVNEDIVPREHWPEHLDELLADAQSQGDALDDIEIRRTGFITTYIWRMHATEARVQLHIRHFNLEPAPANGVEMKEIVEHFPRVWKQPSSKREVFAFPLELPGAQDGEFEFVLLNDRSTGWLYFYYYFNF